MTSALLAGLDVGADVVDADLLARWPRRSARCRRSAGRSAGPARAARATAAAESGLICVGERDQAERLDRAVAFCAATWTSVAGPASRGPSSPTSASRRAARAAPSLPTSSVCAVDRRDDAEPGLVVERCRARAGRCRARARAATIALASGCSLNCSAAAARRRTSSSGTPFERHDLRRRPACPRVIVPVLSSTTVSIRSAFCSASMSRIEDAALRAAAGADHQRRGHRQPQRARAGDDQHAAHGLGDHAPRRRGGPAVRRAPGVPADRR